MSRNIGKQIGWIRKAAFGVVIVAVLAPFGISLVSFVAVQGSESDPPFLKMPDPSHKECVRETSYMRLHHWELLRQIREEVVRYGVRGEVNLASCRECHTYRDDFCNRCHDAVNLTPDCFGCHYYPSSAQDSHEANLDSQPTSGMAIKLARAGDRKEGR